MAIAVVSFARILFPVDFSGPSGQAAPYVADMAARFGSRLLVLHVAEPHVSPYPMPAAATPAAMQRDQEKRAERQHELESFVSAFFPSIPAESRLTEGDPAECIVVCAREFQADLIMMPTHGYGKFRRLLLGSVTAKVLHDAECPVWTGVHADQVPGQPTGWQRFLCAVDEDRRDVPLLRWAAQFAREQGVELRVVHAVHAAAPIHAAHESGGLGDFLMRMAKENLARMQAEAGTNFDIQYAFGRVGQVVGEAASDHQADLILLGRGAIRKGFGRLRSSAYEVIRDAPCPVISV